MARKKQPPKPYYSIRHDFVDSLSAFEQAAGLLYVSVTTILSMRDHIKDSVAQKMLGELQRQADAYAAAVHGVSELEGTK